MFLLAKFSLILPSNTARFKQRLRINIFDLKVLFKKKKLCDGSCDPHQTDRFDRYDPKEFFSLRIHIFS